MENEFSVVKENLTTAKDGKNYKTKYYNLDLIYENTFNSSRKRLSWNYGWRYKKIKWINNITGGIKW